MIDSLPQFWASLNSYWSMQLIHVGSVVITPRKVILTLFAVWFFHLLSHTIEKALHRALVKKDFDPGAKVAIERFTRYGVFTIGIVITLTTVGINLSTLEKFIAVLGVGIGFGLQNITQNFISGLILLTERPIKRGDIVTVDGSIGRVLDIRSRSTLVLTRDDTVIIVPNSEFITKQVINHSFSGDRIRCSIALSVTYDTNVDLVEKLLLSVAEEHPKVLQIPPPSVSLRDFGAASLDFSLRVWLSELWFHEVILSELRFEIDRKFKKHGIIENLDLRFTKDSSS